MTDITCSIVLYHNPIAEIRAAIESFLNCNKSVKLYLVDNSSNDLLRYQFISPQIEYIFNGRNLGYGAGHNLAIQKVIGRSKYHLVLNPDVSFEPAILHTLFDFMQQNKEVGLVMPQVFYKNGNVQYLCKKLPAPSDLILRRFLPGPLQGFFKKHLNEYELRHKDYGSMMKVPNLSGCFMFLRTEALSKVGFFDERYFLYLEDTDLCRRINEKFLTIYHPGVSIIHGYSKASYRSFGLMKLHLASSIKYFNKWGWLKDDKRKTVNAAVVSNAFHPRVQVQKETQIQQLELLS